MDVDGTGMDQCRQIFRCGEQFHTTIRNLYVRVCVRIFRTMVNPRYVLREIHQK